MKDFKEATLNGGQPYVVVRNNQVELRKTGFTGPLTFFGQGATSAILSGDTVVVTFKDGRVAEYQLTPGNNSVIHIRNL
jgi:hypothetical protein